MKIIVHGVMIAKIISPDKALAQWDLVITLVEGKDRHAAQSVAMWGHADKAFWPFARYSIKPSQNAPDVAHEQEIRHV